MMNQRQLFLTLIPAILIAGLVLFIRVAQYEPLYPEEEYIGEDNQTNVQIPILPTDPIIGEKKAPKTVIVFEDFGCAPCTESMNSFFAFVEDNPGKVKLVWKGLPVVRIPVASDNAHLVSICANKQGKFEPFMRALFENGTDVSEEAIDAATAKANLDIQDLASCLATTSPLEEINTNKTIAQALGVQAVPTLFMNNNQIEPPRTAAGWKTALGL